MNNRIRAANKDVRLLIWRYVWQFRINRINIKFLKHFKWVDRCHYLSKRHQKYCGYLECNFNNNNYMKKLNEGHGGFFYNIQSNTKLHIYNFKNNKHSQSNRICHLYHFSSKVDSKIK